MKYRNVKTKKKTKLHHLTPSNPDDVNDQLQVYLSLSLWDAKCQTPAVSTCMYRYLWCEKKIYIHAYNNRVSCEHE